MTTDDNTLQKIKKIHERIVITIGVLIGVTLSIYFFTFAMLIDRDANTILWFQIITTALFIIGLIFIKRLGLFLTRVLLSGSSEYRHALKTISVTDLEKA